MNWDALAENFWSFLDEHWSSIWPLITGGGGIALTAFFAARREKRNLRAAHQAELARIAQQHTLDQATRLHDRARKYADDARLDCADQLDWLRSEWMDFDVKYSGEDQYRHFVASVRVSTITSHNAIKVRQLSELLPSVQTRRDIDALMTACLRLHELLPHSAWNDSSPFVPAIRLFELASAVLACWLRSDELEPSLRSQVNEWAGLVTEGHRRSTPRASTDEGLVQATAEDDSAVD